MLLQLQYVQLINDKTNAAYPWSDEFAISVSVTWTITIRNPLTFHKLSQKLANSDNKKGNTELYCLFTAADSIVDAISLKQIETKFMSL